MPTCSSRRCIMWKGRKEMDVDETVELWERMSEANVVDYTDAYGNCLLAQGKGTSVLILHRLDKPFRRFDGQMADYELEYRWLSTECKHERDESWACVQGNEFSYWRKEEIDTELAHVINGNKTLFDIFDLL